MSDLLDAVLYAAGACKVMKSWARTLRTQLEATC
jgi:hypothetical protein